MNDKAKIHLSAPEMELVNNTEWIFTKRLIIQKVYHLLGELNERYKIVMAKEAEFFPKAFQKSGGKITKGENYEGLPYLVLDYPAQFSKENIFAVRTMFWWGNFFSISLHLSGNHAHFSGHNIFQRLEFLQQKNFWICINENEWEHHFRSSNFINAHDPDEQLFEKISSKNFFKIAKKIELAQWDFASQFLEQAFEEIIQFIKISFPNGEKAL